VAETVGNMPPNSNEFFAGLIFTGVTPLLAVRNLHLNTGFRIHLQIQALFPVLVILRVALEDAHESDNSSENKISRSLSRSMQFASRNAARSNSLSEINLQSQGITFTPLLLGDRRSESKQRSFSP